MNRISHSQQRLRILGVIPARFNSSRLPGKPLEYIGDKTVIERVWRNTVSSHEFDRVVVATDDQRIFDAVKSFGGEAVLTPSEIENGSLRAAAAFHLLDEDFDVIANIQGDQPFVSKEAINALLRPFRENRATDMTTIASVLDQKLASDPNTVKVVFDAFGKALYFSRSLIPFTKNVQDVTFYQHLGLYAFHKESIDAFERLMPSPLEKAENLEQLRALENGLTILVEVVSQIPIEINTPQDLASAREWVALHEGRS